MPSPCGLHVVSGGRSEYLQAILRVTCCTDPPLCVRVCVCVCVHFASDVDRMSLPRSASSAALLSTLPPSHLDAPFVLPAQQVTHGSDLIRPLLSVLARLGDQLCGCDIGHAHSLLDEHGPAAGTSPSSLVLPIMRSRQVSSLDSALSVTSASHHLASAPNTSTVNSTPSLT
jgi:hypothetical protein